jgi:hypothetical protein
VVLSHTFSSLAGILFFFSVGFVLTSGWEMFVTCDSLLRSRQRGSHKESSKADRDEELQSF